MNTLWKGLFTACIIAATAALAGCVAPTDEEVVDDADTLADTDENVGEASQAWTTLTCWYAWPTKQLNCAGPGNGGTWAYGFYSSPGYQYPSYPSGNWVSWFNCLQPQSTTSHWIRVQYWADTGYYGETWQACGY